MLCGQYANACNYKCCQQDSGGESELSPGNYLLIYPEELADKSESICKHIKLVSDNFYGGSLGFCDAKIIDQSGCCTSKNFKPLDCRSYPFVPAFINQELVLIADKRCPIVQERELNKKKLDELYQGVISAWRRAVLKNEKVAGWIKSLDLPTYELYESEK